jgi:hypothetical protein
MHFYLMMPSSPGHQATGSEFINCKALTLSMDECAAIVFRRSPRPTKMSCHSWDWGLVSAEEGKEEHPK